jgi:benzoyl-CoA reductase/2-hydroxyglutaryl-CoA dehydratase subunit BcrC/BadD/HgdB
MSIPREVFNEKLEKLIEKLAGRKVFEKQSPRLLVMGAACDSPGLIDFIEQRGVSVVADNICFGLRHFSGQIDEGGDPVRSIANRYFERIPCPSAIDHIDLSLKYMKQIINDLNVNGIISVRLKFCDHWAGLNKLIHEKLSEELNVPMLELEREYSSTSSGQLSTRLQAFIEVLNG